MKLQVERLQFATESTDRYPYTHRIECQHLADYFQIINWIEENKIATFVIQDAKAFYLNADNTAWLLLRWQ